MAKKKIKVKKVAPKKDKPVVKKKVVGNLGKDSKGATRLSSGGFGQAYSVSTKEVEAKKKAAEKKKKAAARTVRKNIRKSK